MTLRFTLAFSFISAFFFLPDATSLGYLFLGALALTVRVKGRRRRVLKADDLLAAWAYERLAATPGRESVLNRLSGGEVATLLEACATLQELTSCDPQDEPGADTEDWIVRHLRASRLDTLREGRDIDSTARLMRTIESNSPRPLRGSAAVRECRRLTSSHPDLVLQMLKEWGCGPDAPERFSRTIKSEPHRMQRLIERYHQDLDEPGLNPDEEVSIFLELLETDVSKILKEELGKFPQTASTLADVNFVAEKFVTRLWSKLASEQPIQRS